jgi:inner membrane transporter RhtA
MRWRGSGRRRDESSDVFGIPPSDYRAAAALAGFVVLSERLTPLQWRVIACIVFASAGSATTAGREE